MRLKKGLAFNQLVLFILAGIALVFLLFYVFQAQNEGTSLLKDIGSFF
jgi:hypothetical protein